MPLTRLCQIAVLVVCPVLAVSAETASPPVFEALSGWFGTTHPGAADCASNPRYQSFTPDHRRILFHWAKPHQSSYLGKVITDNGGDVVGFDDSSVAHIRDFEPEVDAAGVPIQWTYHVKLGNPGFCVSRSDAPETGCHIYYIRCATAVPMS